MVIGNRNRACSIFIDVAGLETWSKYEKINLVYSVRTASELAYVERIQEIAKTFGEGHKGFKFIPIITRDPNAALHDRLPGAH